MKKITLLVLLLASTTLQLFSQTAPATNPLVGTWIESRDSVEEVKIISPTHVFFIVRNVNNNDFYGAGAGPYTINGNRYTEKLNHASIELNTEGSPYDFKVDGDKFYQKGTLILKDGTKIPIEHTFTRVKTNNAYNGPHVGTWNQLSSSFLHDDGTKGSHTNATHTRFEVITPTHWMRISAVDKKFENAFGGTYKLAGDKAIYNIDFASFPVVGATAELTQRAEGNKMTWAGIVKDANGKKINEIVDVFEKVGE